MAQEHFSYGVSDHPKRSPLIYILRAAFRCACFFLVSFVTTPTLIFRISPRTERKSADCCVYWLGYRELSERGLVRSVVKKPSVVESVSSRLVALQRLGRSRDSVDSSALVVPLALCEPTP
jgi:hypothetical protein